MRSAGADVSANIFQGSRRAAAAVPQSTAPAGGSGLVAARRAVPQVADGGLGLAPRLALAQVADGGLGLAPDLALPQVAEPGLGLAGRVAGAHVLQRGLGLLGRVAALCSAQPRHQLGPPAPKLLLDFGHHGLSFTY